MTAGDWPELPFDAWSSTCATLHLWTQIVGKIRLAHAPLVNHWWNIPLYVSSRGLTTSLIPQGTRGFQIDFDFIDHQLAIHADNGANEVIPLRPQSVAGFHAELMRRLAALGLETRIWPMPVEIPDAVPFDQDHIHASYDADYVHRFWRVLLQADRLMKQFRAPFLGKVSPVHFFWGSFDMAVTRFSGRPAPEMNSESPNLGAWVMREAYSHEVSSCGFWPGNGGYGRAAFYCYAYPEPADYGKASVQPEQAYYDQDLGQFILPYDAVRRAASPDDLVIRFFQTTYGAAADRAGWDRSALERKE